MLNLLNQLSTVKILTIAGIVLVIFFVLYTIRITIGTYIKTRIELWTKARAERKKKVKLTPREFYQKTSKNVTNLDNGDRGTGKTTEIVMSGYQGFLDKREQAYKAEAKQRELGEHVDADDYRAAAAHGKMFGVYSNTPLLSPEGLSEEGDIRDVLEKRVYLKHGGIGIGSDFASRSLGYNKNLYYEFYKLKKHVKELTPEEFKKYTPTQESLNNVDEVTRYARKIDFVEYLDSQAEDILCFILQKGYTNIKSIAFFKRLNFWGKWAVFFLNCKTRLFPARWWVDKRKARNVGEGRLMFLPAWFGNKFFYYCYRVQRFAKIYFKYDRMKLIKELGNTRYEIKFKNSDTCIFDSFDFNKQYQAEARKKAGG